MLISFCVPEVRKNGRGRPEGIGEGLMTASNPNACVK